jgi:hypothetical protein
MMHGFHLGRACLCPLSLLTTPCQPFIFVHPSQGPWEAGHKGCAQIFGSNEDSSLLSSGVSTRGCVEEEAHTKKTKTLVLGIEG